MFRFICVRFMAKPKEKWMREDLARWDLAMTAEIRPNF